MGNVLLEWVFDLDKNHFHEKNQKPETFIIQNHE
jgi:hypothetical protein